MLALFLIVMFDFFRNSQTRTRKRIKNKELQTLDLLLRGVRAAQTWETPNG